MADNNLPPSDNNDTRENRIQGGGTRPNVPARQDDTEHNQRNRTEILRKSESTRANRVPPPGQHVQPLPGTPDRRRQAPPPGYAPRSRRRRNEAKDSGLYLPLWSIILMLIGVLIVSAIVVGGVYFLGNPGSFLVEPSPIILIVTADIDAINDFNTQAVQQQAPSTEIISGQNAPSSLDLAGPTLAPVQISPTPAPIRVGSVVFVEGVGADMLNVRSSSSLTESVVLFRAEELEVFNVIAGPEQSEGFTWWQIQDPADVNRTGWAVSNFLTVQTP